MRIAASILALLWATALAVPVLADPGNGNGGGVSRGSENSGNANAGSGNNSGNASGSGNGHANGNETANGDTGNQVTKVPRDQNVAREAVKNREVLSLSTVTALVGETTRGRMLDVELVRLASVYLYEVTVLEPDGRLHKLYYNARSGALVDD